MEKNKIESSVKDLFVIFFITIIISTVLINIDAFELYLNYTQNHEEYELDEIILVLFVGALSAIWYAIRRYNEVKELKNKLEGSNKKLQKENIQKDDLLLEQMKMASLGEMLQNIAHQWRQPLSSISTSASGLKLQKEYKLLTDDDLYKSLDNIVENTKYLSQTIDSFRNYMKENQVKKLFNPDDNINKNLDILSATLKSSYINIVLDLNANINIEGFPNELTQVLINIVNNSKDALESNNMTEKYIFISSKVKDDELFIEIKDNANGIKNDIIHKVFEPYFTTKHKSKGTGLGLYMSYKIITEKMKGKIWVKNEEFTHNDKKFIGAQFNILLPLK